jgi:hypothetical protein
VNPLVYLDRVAARGGSAADPDASIAAVTPPAAHVAVANADAIAAPISEPARLPDPEPIRAPDPAPVSAPADPDGFSDVSAAHRYHDAIIALKKRGVVSGNGGKFYPDNNVSRVELLKMVFLAGGIAADAGSAVQFRDVEAGAWYLPYVNTAKARGIVGGYEDGSFRPNNPVTRAEGLKIIVNTLAPGMSAGMDGSSFADIELGAWYAPYAELAQRKNLMDFSGTEFSAGKFMTRAEVASVIDGLSRK